MKKYLALTVWMLCQLPTAFGQDTLKRVQTLEEIQYLNILENGYQGNIILEVVDEYNIPVNDYRSVLRAGDEIIFDVPQPGPRSTFYKDGSGLTVEIEKKGYDTYISKPITVSDQMEMACVIKIVLKKKK